MDRRPTTYDHKKPLDLVPRMQERVSRLPQVAEADVRLREQGHAVTGEVFVVPRDPSPRERGSRRRSCARCTRSTGGCTR